MSEAFLNPGDRTVLESDRLLYEHGARIKVLETSRNEDKAYIETRFTRIENAVRCSDQKLDKILESQAVAAAVREANEKSAKQAIADVAEKTLQAHAEAEYNALRRERRIAGYTGTITGIVIVIIGEVVRWYLRAHWGGA